MTYDNYDIFVFLCLLVGEGKGTEKGGQAPWRVKIIINIIMQVEIKLIHGDMFNIM